MHLSARANKLLFIPIALLLILAGYFSLGYYYGWMDDVINVILLRGMLNAGASSTAPGSIFAFPHPFVTDPIAFLYKALPSIAWYGWVMYGFLTLAFCGVALVLQEVVKRRPLATMALITMVFLFTWMEHFVLFTYTGVAVLLAGSGMLLLVHNYFFGENKRLLNILAFTLLFFGLCSRFQSGAVTIIYGSAYFTYGWFSRDFGKWRKLIPLGLVVLLGIGFFGITKMACFDAERKALEQIDDYNFTINDADLAKPDHSFSEVDKTKFTAVVLWYFGDKEGIDLETWQKFTYSSPFQSVNLKDWKSKLKNALGKANAYSGAYSCFNWYTLFLFLFIFGMAAWSYLFIGSIVLREWTVAFGILIATSVFLGILLLIAIVVKMEYRLAFPLITIFATSGIIELVRFRSRHPEYRAVRYTIPMFAIVMIGFIICRMPVWRNISAVKGNEVAMKRNFIKELNAFDGEIFQMDHLSLLLLHDTPFFNVSLNPANEYMGYGEYWLNYIDVHEQYAFDKCRTETYIETMKCLCDPEKEIIFVQLEERLDFIGQYLGTVYDYRPEFEQVKEGNALEKIEYSFFNFPMNLNYYKVRGTRSR